MDVRVDPEGVLREMEDAVRELGLPFLCVNQEYDASQWEINTRFGDALTAADEAYLLKLAIKEIAARHGLVATFMGRPVSGIGTSGYHVHYSGWDASSANTFHDPSSADGLSATARWFLAGLLAHARGMCAVLAPTVNAYKRFVAMELAPFFVNWGHDNRSVYVRVPLERGAATRLEARGADGAANVYLAAAIGIFAGLDGIARSLDPGEPKRGIYDGEGCEVLPLSLGDALDALESDTYLRERLSEQFVRCFTTIKRDETRRFGLAVTDWELNEYAAAL
jgi:glutamine synthetase